MLDLSLFRRPAFTGASLVAFSVSASMFSMFLYLTLYIQDVLGYSPLQAGLRFLPITLLSFFVAPISGALSVRMPIRVLLGSGLLLVSAGLLAMTAVDASSRLDHPDPGLRPRRCGDRDDQPAAGLDRRSEWSTTPAPGWPRGSTTPSARSGSQRASPAWEPSSSTRSQQDDECAECRRAGTRSARGHPRASRRGARLGRSQRVRRRAPAAARGALEHAYRVGFTGALTTILEIGGGIALLGALAGFALVRQRDFVNTRSPGRGAARRPRRDRGGRRSRRPEAAQPGRGSKPGHFSTGIRG